MNCHGCNKKVFGVDYLECSRCSLKYHRECVNSPATLDWICPSCVCKIPKGDNDNVAIRPATPTGVNVAQRKKRLITEVDVSGPVTIDDLRAILREELKAQDTRLGRRIDELCSQMNEFRLALDFQNEQFEKLRSENIAQQESLKTLRKENDSLRTAVNSLTTRLNQMDQVSRAPNLEIQCVPENRSENLLTIVKQVGRVINCPVADSEIHYCSRTAKVNHQSTRPRNILVKFSHPRLRDEFLAAVITYNKKHPDDKLNTSHLGIGGDKKSSVYVAENLSPENKSLHSAARIRAKELNYKFVWVRAGRIYMRKTETSGFVFVRDMDTLNKLL